MRVQGWGPHRCPAGGATERAPPATHLEVQVHQLVLLEDVVDLPRLQPGVRLLLLQLEVDENAQTALGVVQRRPAGPGGERASERALLAGRPSATPAASRCPPAGSARPAKKRRLFGRKQGRGGGHSVPTHPRLHIHEQKFRDAQASGPQPPNPGSLLQQVWGEAFGSKFLGDVDVAGPGTLDRCFSKVGVPRPATSTSTDKPHLSGSTLKLSPKCEGQAPPTSSSPRLLPGFSESPAGRVLSVMQCQ